MGFYEDDQDGKAVLPLSVKRQRVILCEDSVEGILSAIHMAYLSRYGHKYITIQLRDKYEPDMFCDYIAADTDYDKAMRVAEAIRKKIGAQAWEMVHMASLYGGAGCQEKAQAIYRFLNLGFASGSAVCSHLSEPYVNQVFKMGRAVGRETQHLKGFVRFRELNSGVLFSKISPKHQQLYWLGEHFADRLPGENWVIYDELRHLACIHRSVYSAVDGGRWVIAGSGEAVLHKINDISESEQDFLLWWKTFFAHIEIKERKNPRCQMNMMPKRFWPNMPEMQR